MVSGKQIEFHHVFVDTSLYKKTGGGFTLAAACVAVYICYPQQYQQSLIVGAETGSVIMGNMMTMTHFRHRRWS